MNCFFEEDGAFKAGRLMTANETSCQIELPTGRRIKVKKSHILAQFESPAPSVFMEQAQQTAEEIDLELLWEFAPEEEFTFQQVAEDYFGSSPNAVQLAGTVLRLHGNPVYFYRKGRGKYRKAPQETLKLALAAIERKRQLDLLKDQYVAELLEGKAPKVIADQAMTLMTRPDKNSIEWKALREASDELSVSPLRLLLKTGAIANAWRWHVGSFFTQNFPRGRKFPANIEKPDTASHEQLPLSEARAFSIDDSNTTEVDDALSVTPLGEGRTRVGIHISAPSLAIARGSIVDETARERMSTVYAPGLKTTMLPDEWVKAYSLDEGRICPAVSLYAVVDDETHEIIAEETRLERVHIVSNLRYDKIESEVTEEKVLAGELSIPFGNEIVWLWHFARSLLAKREAVRGRPEPKGRVEWYFDLQGEDENARIQLKSRTRGAPLDLLVAEMMIFANSRWGAWLEQKKTAGIYRSQRMGRVKMTSVPGPHDGIGVERYAWSTSPLRRYVDLVNQRQLIAAIRQEPAPYRQNDSDLFSVISAFDANYTAFNDFQSRMDRYWSLRWLSQEGISEVKATVVKGDLVRIDGLPMAQRVPGLPELPRGQALLMEVLNLDFIELVMECRLLKVLDGELHELDSDEDRDEVQQADQTQIKQTENSEAASEAPA